MKAINLIYLLTGLTFLTACNKEDEPEVSSIYPVSGHWYVMFDYEAGTIVAEDLLLIYGTSFSEDSAWVDDENFYPSKVKVAVEGTTFSVNNGPDLGGAGRVNIIGEVFNEDSIYVTFNYVDTGETVIASGHRATGFE